MLNAFVLTAQAAMKVYMFHSCQFHAPVMSPFFSPHDLYEDITLDDMHPPFHLSRYPTDKESDSDTQLTPIYSVESDPSESSHPTYYVGSYRSEPSHPSVIRLSSDSFASSAGLAPPPVPGHGFFASVPYLADVGVFEEEDVEMMHLVGSGMDISRLMDDMDDTC